MDRHLSRSSPGIAADRRSDLSLGRQLARPFLGGPSGAPAIGQTSSPFFAGDRRRQTDRPFERGQMDRPLRRSGVCPFGISFLRMRGAREGPRPSSPGIRPRADGQTFCNLPGGPPPDSQRQMARPLLRGEGPPTDDQASTNGQTSSPGIAADSWTDLLASQEGHRGQMDRTNGQTSSPFWRLTPWHLISGNADR
jgi:hypothetical protein